MINKEKDLKKLSRKELLQLLLEVSLENNKLEKENKILRRRLRKRELDIENFGSLAEASIQISGVLEKAQAAADIYIDNIKRIHEKTKKIYVSNEEKNEPVEFLFEDLKVKYGGK